MEFSEVYGLAIVHEVIEYRDGAAPEQVIKMPGLRQYSNIILKRGIVKGDNDFYNWINTISNNTVEKRDVVIRLLDQTHEPVQGWRLHNAWPCKVIVPDLNATANDVAMETIELVHEGLEIVL
jgi:phage tail-like protein